MPDIKLKTRIQNKYKTFDEWSQIIPGDFVPLKGEICYGIKDGFLYQKLGDGETDFVDLPWLLNQADNEESDPNSPAYIKNRLAYPEYIEVPEDEQILYSDEIVAESIATKDMVLEVFENEQVKAYVDANLDNSTNIFVGGTSIGGPAELIQNKYNKLFVNIYTSTNNKISYDFNSKDKIQSEITILGYSVFCFGNTHWANIFTNIFFETIDSPILYYPQDNISTEKYCVVLIGPFVDDNIEGYEVFVAFDNDIYPCKEEQDTDGAFLYKYPYDIQLLATGQMHTIDEKYLGDVRSDFNTLKADSKSYIKNRPGVNGILELNDGATLGDVSLGKYSATITTGPYSNELGAQTLRGETVHENLADPMVMSIVETCTVKIAGTTWNHCPVFQARLQYSSDQNDAYYIGNPYYITEHINKLWGLGAAGGSIKGYEVYESEDNGLPFLISYCPDSAQPLWDGELIRFPKKYSNKETVSVSITPEKIRLGTNILRKDILPVDTIIGTLDNRTNSILLNSAYEASGTNSIAAGYGTKAIGSNSVAINNNTLAQAANSFASGYGTKTIGANSIAGGQDTIANDNQTVAFGRGSWARGIGSVAIGDCISETSSILRINSQSIYVSNLDRTDYDFAQLTYKDENNNTRKTPWFRIHNSSVYIEDNGEYRIYLSISDGNEQLSNYSSEFSSIELRVVNRTQLSNSFALGQGARANGQGSFALGYDTIASDHYQFTIGQCNKATNGAFVIGNGSHPLYSTAPNRSNALVIDWSGNATFAGQISTSSIILTSPNGTKFKITVNDEGTLTSTKIN